MTNWVDELGQSIIKSVTIRIGPHTHEAVRET